MASYTSNYQLHQWVPEDNFLRTDFNTDFQKIDAGIKAARDLAASKDAWVEGSYAGTGTETRTVSLGFYPRAVVLENMAGNRYNSIGGIALRGKPLGYASTPIMEITSTGFQLDKASANDSAMTYHYLALK